MRRFSFTWYFSLMPLSTTAGSGWFQIQRRAPATGFTPFSSNNWLAPGGICGPVRKPPKSGSMIATPSPLLCAYCRPRVPA